MFYYIWFDLHIIYTMGTWYKMDTVGIIYAPTANKKWCGVFGVSAVMLSPIDKDILQLALNQTMKTFNFFNVRLKHGFFWYYLEEHKNCVEIEKQCKYPCSPFEVSKGKHLMRVVYSSHRITVEFFHGLTDGSGGWIFLKALLFRYLSLCGLQFDSDANSVCNIAQSPKLATLNAYDKIASPKNGFLNRKSNRAFKLNLPLAQGDRYYLTHFELDCTQLKAKAKNLIASVGELLVAVLVLSIEYCKYSLSNNKKGNIVVNLSYDLRKRFDIQTLRNFFGHALLEIQQTDLNIYEVLKQVQKCMRSVDDSYLLKCVNLNVSSKNNLFNKFVPLTIKKPILNLAYYMYGEKLATISFSNYGQAVVPKQFLQHIDRFESSCGVAKSNRLIEASAVSFANKTVLTVCVKSESTVLEQNVSKQLSNLGLAVKIDSNRTQ